MEENQTKKNNFRKYEFGEIIQNKNIPCYKILKGGKVTVYLALLDRRLNKETTYESKLNLAKIRNFT